VAEITSTLVSINLSSRYELNGDNFILQYVNKKIYHKVFLFDFKFLS